MRRFLWSGRTAQRRWAMIGKVVAGVEQSSEEVGQTVGGRSGVVGNFLGDVESRGKGGQPTWGGDDRRPSAPSALCTVSTTTRNRAVHRIG
jgi:hypothetical protein